MQAEEHPQSGIAGLRHWRYDVDAGLQVELVSLLLSPGITVASGAPLITGKKGLHRNEVLRHIAIGNVSD